MKTEDYIKNFADKIYREKEGILKERILKLTGEELDIEKESEKMFKRVCKVHSTVDQSETWYWDNGTKEGLKLVTFYPLENEYNNITNEITTKMRFE